MKRKFELFANVVRDYPAFKAQFGSFCKMSDAALNSNPQLPGVQFSEQSSPLGGGAVAADVFIFDQKFVLRFHLVASAAADAGAERCVGVLGVYLPTVRDEELMIWHMFFDIHGNVKEALDGRAASYRLADKEFLDLLLSEVADRYFSRLVLKFQPSALPPQ